MVGMPAEGTMPATPGYWAWILIVPLGLMAYMVFSPKHNWMSRIPIGLLLGLGSGQYLKVYWTQYGPQIEDTMRPILPTVWDRFTVPVSQGIAPEKAAEIASNTYMSQAASNLVFMLTVACIISYFIFSVDFKSKTVKAMSLSGRWLLMVGFGAIFGSTVMMRFTLLIDRMYFVWIEGIKNTIFGIQ